MLFFISHILYGKLQWLWPAYPNSRITIHVLWHVHKMTRDVDKNFNSYWHWPSMPSIISYIHLEVRHATSIITYFGQHISASALKVKIASIKRYVMGVSWSITGTMWTRMAAKLPLLNTADFLFTARRRCATDISSDSITDTQELAFFTMPELLSRLSVASIIVAAATSGGNTAISIQHQSIIALASPLARQCALEGKWETRAGRRTGCATQFVMCISWTVGIWEDKTWTRQWMISTLKEIYSFNSENLVTFVKY